MALDTGIDFPAWRGRIGVLVHRNYEVLEGAADTVSPAAAQAAKHGIPSSGLTRCKAKPASLSVSDLLNVTDLLEVTDLIEV
eukprot:CAMPEP_0197627032 /NCGR_PEP_ID=MMETSP1338-20131121/5760_1 /TAXON_ID=43686 ORGANISM="Pelagodinium beii, Strain RCC1491" /NCGR_SAMPLE_ID=MMETSP1338 /ASSEMBLY_ACC=CAM_ASM_000754 /LENGTH=81 /DNA_ID=CAMNT_0043197645 /DNA_START=94 /DNA_END=339 /DNA_ORIENTATION=-